LRNSYLDVKKAILERIRTGIWPPGASLPGEIDLATEFGCARATVSRAMRDLVADGILDRKRKAGTRVRSAPTRRAEFTIPLIREEIIATGAQYGYALVEREVEIVPVWLRAQLGLPAKARVLRVVCVHYADNLPFQVEDRWINLSAVPEAAVFDFEAIGPNDWLVRKVPFTDAELAFSATLAQSRIAEMLGVVPGSAVFTVERTTWLEGAGVTFARLHFAPHYKMTTRY
jgi:GntR family histidine utilization transcriptional repressor